jgi:hypothetical protein
VRGIMRITKEWLQEKSACDGGVDWFLSQKETNGIKVVKKLIKEKKLDWANCDYETERAQALLNQFVITRRGKE